MTIDAGPVPADSGTDGETKRRGFLRRLGEIARNPLRWLSSSLGRRIVVLNLAGLAALMLGYLSLNQFRTGLIEPRIQSLLAQGEIIAGAISASATVEQNTITLDPDKLLQEQAGEPRAVEDEAQALFFSINPERVAPLVNRLAATAKARARVYDTQGFMIVDTRGFFSRGEVRSGQVASPPVEDRTIIARTWNFFRGRFGRTGVPLGEEQSPVDTRGLPEVQKALRGVSESIVRVNQRGETVISVAVPIKRLQIVRGALLLSTEGGDIDRVIAQERIAIVQIFLVAAAVMLVLSLLLANTIADPMRKLAAAAERVRHGVKARVEIPDYSGRADEVGHLSGTLRDMTRALYNRIEAIESFAADVAHELKNPLTSVRSAVETLPLARNEESRKRLLAVINHDVRRLDRLISDISDASRLDADLARTDTAPVDLAKLAETVIGVQNEVAKPGEARIEIDIPAADRAAKRFFVNGRDIRLGQVLTNLVDNARSFSPPGGSVRVKLRRIGRDVEIAVEDDGPGIPEHALERIFERFYTDRPHQGFGDNSGLGLSISRQIVDAHGGTIRAGNRPGGRDAAGQPAPAGARFVVRLPADDTGAR